MSWILLECTAAIAQDTQYSRFKDFDWQLSALLCLLKSRSHPSEQTLCHRLFIQRADARFCWRSEGGRPNHIPSSSNNQNIKCFPFSPGDPERRRRWRWSASLPDNCLNPPTDPSLFSVRIPSMQNSHPSWQTQLPSVTATRIPAPAARGEETGGFRPCGSMHQQAWRESSGREGGARS